MENRSEKMPLIPLTRRKNTWDCCIIKRLRKFPNICDFLKVSLEMGIFLVELWTIIILWIHIAPFLLDVTKKVQELYAIINYGEMRKKIPVDNQKFYMKLRELVYRGSVTWRVKGKNCRIKTPSCPALRKINQVESELWFDHFNLCMTIGQFQFYDLFVSIFSIWTFQWIFVHHFSHLNRRMARGYKIAGKSWCWIVAGWQWIMVCGAEFSAKSSRQIIVAIAEEID